MTVAQAFRYELDPTVRQRRLLAKAPGTAHHAFNWGRALCKRPLDGGRPVPHAAELHRLWNAEKPGRSWVYGVSKCCGQEALRDRDRALGNCWRGRKEGRWVGFPRFRRKHAAQMPLRRAGAFALQTAAQPKVTGLDTAPLAAAAKAVPRGYGGSAQAEVHAYCGTVLSGGGRVGQFDGDMQIPLPLTVDKVTVDKVGGERPAASVLRVMLREDERDRHAPRRGGQPHLAGAPLQGCCVEVVAGRAGGRLRATRLAALLAPVEGRTLRLCCLHARPDQQVGDQIRALASCYSVSEVMQPRAVSASATACSSIGFNGFNVSRAVR